MRKLGAFWPNSHRPNKLPSLEAQIEIMIERFYKLILRTMLGSFMAIGNVCPRVHGAFSSVSLSGLAGDGGVMDGLRTELSAIVERSRIGDRKQQELEQIISRLEDEVARYSAQAIQLEERLADKMAQIASLESKLGQRNLKVVDLQNEVEAKISENGILQREVVE